MPAPATTTSTTANHGNDLDEPRLGADTADRGTLAAVDTEDPATDAVEAPVAGGATDETAAMVVTTGGGVATASTRVEEIHGPYE